MTTSYRYHGCIECSNEIGGDGDIPHDGVGPARRIQVPQGAGRAQHRVMVEAVENHMPEVIVIDEIGTEAEALAARTVAQRGVQLIATAHGAPLNTENGHMQFSPLDNTLISTIVCDGNRQICSKMVTKVDPPWPDQLPARMPLHTALDC